ncbi:terminase small subunit [Yersinia kristensenii]|uniref:terminase small subunit n=1 Tax=Yersinia kristensenii TaxID=28152 RepID=UPI0001A5426D|nr:terminase small subunit [Yersinia kristensenii]EEP89170.1 hypothetical protein ykris0001_2290 [Yersinia kristensenii ATCC 33638]PEH52763.1 terminase small subunit [Yersinia kristensenii]SUP70618.1 Terminase small subunit [Yersinia kristensenii]
MSKPEESGLERDYCSGQLSLRKLADKYGISEGAIRKRAIKNGWVRAPKSGTQVRKNGTQKKSVRTNSKQSLLPQVNQVRGKALPLPPIQSEDQILDPDEFGLNDQQALFVLEYVRTRSRVDAYRKAGYKCEGNTAYASASRLYRNAKVSRAIRAINDRMRKRFTACLEDLVDQLVAIANADPNELVQYRRVNCRYCWGENHLYQWRDIGEYDKAAAKASEEGKQAPEYGGIGFMDNADLNPECPKCQGEGRGQIFIADTRDLDGPARWLYAGIKESKFGTEVVTANQEAARRDLIKLLEIMKNTPPPVSEKAPEVKDVSAEQAAETYKNLMG